MVLGQTFDSRHNKLDMADKADKADSKPEKGDLTDGSLPAPSQLAE